MKEAREVDRLDYILTFTLVDGHCGPESIVATRGTECIDITVEPVARQTLERDAAVVQR